MRDKKKLKELSPRGKALTAVLIAASLSVVVAAERDIQRRSPSEIRGNPLLWRVVCLNALGALSYLRWGRRTPPV